MKVLAAAFTASATAVPLTWKDCGDASTHGKITDIQPLDIPVGTTTNLVGKGTLDEDVNSATFKFVAKVGPLPILKGSGNVCEDNTIKLPLGAGSIVVHAVDCPRAAGDVELNLDINALASAEAIDGLVNIQLDVAADNGDKLLCAALTTTSTETRSFADIAKSVNDAGVSWKAQAPEKFASVEDVKPFLGAFLPGDAQYQEPEVVDMPASNAKLPTSFDSAEQWPQCTVIANVRDQSSCGSCWAFGSVSSFESRACISTGRDVKYSPEHTAFCQNPLWGAGDGCNGGNSAWDFFKNTGVVSGGDYTDIGSGDTCMPYSLAPCAHHVPATTKYPACPSSEYPSPRCHKSCSESGYATSFDNDKLHATKTFSVRGEEQIMQELTTNGPMYVAFSVYSDFPTYKSGVYTRTSGTSFLGGHAVTLVGYGELDGQKYWKIKNSWNEQWGDNGHFLIARGTDECGIESSVNAGLIASTVV